MNELTLTIPLVPPGLNHATRHTRTGRHYTTGEARAFREAIGLYVRDRFVTGKQFAVVIVIYRGSKQKGDVDGYIKIVIDGLAKSRVFRDAKGKILTDDSVKHVAATKERDVENPRTVIGIAAVSS